MSAPRIHADQIDTDESLVRRLLADQFPRWAHLPVTAVPTSGTENAIYRLGDEMVVRLSYRPGKDDQVDKLDRWLPRFAPHLPLSIPEPLARGAPTQQYPAAWSIVRWLDGEEATLARLDNPVGAAGTLAEFLEADEDVEWTWTSTVDGVSYVSGYAIVKRENRGGTFNSSKAHAQGRT